MEAFLFEAGALLPSIGVGLLFWFAMRAILRADRREREAEREAEREFQAARRKAEAPAGGTRSPAPLSPPAEDVPPRD